MTWLDRSSENLGAARHCEDGGFWGPAVSRYYYAVYQAALEVLEQKGPPAPEQLEGRDYWPHSRVGRQLTELVGDQTEVGLDYEHLRSMRVKADYRRDRTTKIQCKGVRNAAERLIQALEEALHDD